MEPTKSYSKHLESQGSIPPATIYKCKLCGKEMFFNEIAEHARTCSVEIIRIDPDEYINTEY